MSHPGTYSLISKSKKIVLLLICISNNKVVVEPLKISRKNLNKLENNLLLFFTGYSRKSSAILRDQDNKTKKDDDEIIKNLNFVKDLGLKRKI